jgi:hypothetical protein
MRWRRCLRKVFRDAASVRQRSSCAAVGRGLYVMSKIHWRRVAWEGDPPPFFFVNPEFC